MNRIEIPETNFSANIPSSYSEMTSPQVYYVMQQLYALQCAKISQAEFRVRVLYYLAGIKRTARTDAFDNVGSCTLAGYNIPQFHCKVNRFFVIY